MKIIKSASLLLIFITFSYTSSLFAQSFERSELPVNLKSPWEIIYGPDDYLWISEEEGVISRVHPETGARIEIYAAPDYYEGESLVAPLTATRM